MTGSDFLLQDGFVVTVDIYSNDYVTISYDTGRDYLPGDSVKIK